MLFSATVLTMHPGHISGLGKTASSSLLVALSIVIHLPLVRHSARGIVGLHPIA